MLNHPVQQMQAQLDLLYRMQFEDATGRRYIGTARSNCEVDAAQAWEQMKLGLLECGIDPAIVATLVIIHFEECNKTQFFFAQMQIFGGAGFERLVRGQKVVD